MNRSFENAKSVIKYLETIEYRENPTFFKKKKSGGVFGKSFKNQKKFKEKIKTIHNKSDLVLMRESLDVEIETSKDTSFFNNQLITILISTVTIMFSLVGSSIVVLGQVLNSSSNVAINLKIKEKMSDDEKLKIVKDTFISIIDDVYRGIFNLLSSLLFKSIIILILGSVALGYLYIRRVRKLRFYSNLIKQCISDDKVEKKS
ncbi:MULTISPECIES: hypothetical protein [Bacillus]|uniref:hypothetical protein n=1 Tax=Bacillus TaxID=1386 RepID=UPI00080E234B|nr:MULTISPECIES: hypothetical protein [Bacillus]MDE1385329.1 hypothetical protein [Bacillus paralicheniformis]TAI49859.1 hypothetical protein CXP52_22590 [Bacillus paralicheniformis]GIN78030.1 hypothetical protein J41TS8_30710 [Bacillus sp. J41TS8]